MSVVIENKIGVGQENNEADVSALKTALNRLGFYTPNFEEGITGKTDVIFFEAIKNFQTYHGLWVDGEVESHDKTLKMLKEELNNPDNYMGFKGGYIWRTVGDKKVRGAHAIRDGVNFSWELPPDGGHPGEDYGCRCWVEPIVPMMSKGLNLEILEKNSNYDDPMQDAIHSAVSPLDFIGGGFVVNNLRKLFFGKTFRAVEKIADKRFLKQGWLKKELRDKNGVRYFDGKGNSFQINRGYKEGKGIHKKPYIKYTEGDKKIRIPIKEIKK